MPPVLVWDITTENWLGIIIGVQVLMRVGGWIGCVLLCFNGMNSLCAFNMNYAPLLGTFYIGGMVVWSWHSGRIVWVLESDIY